MIPKSGDRFSDRIMRKQNVLRVRPETSRLITEFSEHEADGGEAQERERLAV